MANDDLMIEVTGSSTKASNALDKVIEKVTRMQEAIEKIAPSLSKFTESLDSMASTSKAFSALEKLTKGTGDLSSTSKKAEANEKMYQARLDRATVSMERSRVASEKLAAAREKLAKSAEIDNYNKNLFSMSPEDFAKKFSKSTTTEPASAPIKSVPDQSVPTVNYDVSKIQAEMDAFTAKIGSKGPKINIDTEAATVEVRRMGEYIDSLTPKISHMSAEAQAQFNAIAAKLTTVSQRIDNQRMLYSNLASASARVAQEQGEGSTAYLQLEKRMLSADSATQRLVDTQEKLKAELSSITSTTNKVGAGMTSAGNKAKNAANKSTSAWNGTLRMFEKMMIRIAAFKVFSALSQGIVTGVQDMALASSSANAAMSSLATSSLYLKNSIAAALMPAIQAITPTITWLSNQLANLFNTIGMLSARIFGGSTTFTVAQRANVNYAETLGQTADNASNATKKVKELQRTVMGFDELNVLQKPSEDTTTPKSSANKNPGMPDYGEMFKNVEIPSGIQSLGDKIKSFFSEWAKYAEPTTAAFQRLVNSLEPLKTFAAKGLEDFYNDFLKPVGKWTLGTGLPEFLDVTTQLVQNIDWSGLNKALDNLWQALTPFTIHVGEGLLWFYQYVISPIAQWAANDLIPAALNLLANAIKLIDSVIQALKPSGEWLYENFLKPLGEWTGNVIIDALNGVSDALGKISDWINNNQGAVQNMATTVGIFFAAWKGTELLEFIINAGGVIGILKQLGTAIWTVTGAKIADKAQTIALVALYAKDFVVSVAKGTAEIAKQIAQWVALKAAKIADTIQTVAQTAATKLATLAQGALNVVLNANPIALVIIAIAGLVAAFVTLYNKCAWFRDGWNSIWGNIKDGFKGFINVIIYGLNGIISGINFLIDALDKIKFDVPSWVPNIGGKSIGINIPNVSEIPYLASGALITSATQAVIGEGKDNEAVLPLNNEVYSKIAQGIIKNSNKGNYQTNTSNVFANVFTVDGKVNESVFGVSKSELDSITTDMKKASDDRMKIVDDELSSTKSKWADFFDSISSTFTDKLNNILSICKNNSDDLSSVWNRASDNSESIFRNMFSYVESGFSEFSRSIDETAREIANNISSKIGGSVNGVIEGINWTLSAIGSSTKIDSVTWPSYASGIEGHPGGPALVNDATGSLYREAVQLPNGKTFIPKGRNVFIPDLPKGSKVLPAEKTHKLFPMYANGVGDFFGSNAADMDSLDVASVWEHMGNVGSLLKLVVDKFVQKSDINEPWSSLETSAVKLLTDNASDFIGKEFSKFESSLSMNGSGVDRWSGVATQALKMTGQYSAANLSRLLYQMQTESGGNPASINDWDINAINGTPSKGLMQVIDPTFRAYAYPGYDSNIYDPLSNILAAIRYTLSRYGSLENGWQGHGYAGGIGKFDFGGWCADGGMFDKPTVIGVGESGPEASLPLNDNAFSRIAQGIVKNSDSDNNESVLERMDSIVERMGKLEQAILDRPVALYTDDQKIAESANRGNTRIARRYHTAT